MRKTINKTSDEIVSNLFTNLKNSIFSQFNKILFHKKFAFPFIGFLALLWFIVKVFPKPSRAFYPCQRVAYPIASAFVIWMLGFFGAVFSFRRAKSYFAKSKYMVAISFIFISIISFVVFNVYGTFNYAFSNVTEASATIPQVNDPDADKSVVAPKAFVAIVQSSKSKAADITAEEIEIMVREAVAMAGGFDTLIKDGQTVVVKPNCVWDFASKLVNGQTTDYRIIQAVVNMVREKNPNGKIYVIEGSAGSTMQVMKNLGWLDVTGVDKFFALEDSSGDWRDYNSPKLVKVSLHKGKSLYTAANNTFYFNKIYYEADVIISLPLLKTHSSAAVTGAIKNEAIGMMPATIYGNSASDNNRGNFLDHDGTKNGYHDWLHDFYMARPVDYCIMDALTGLEKGPLRESDGYVKNTRCIIAARNALSMDAIEALILEKDPFKIRYFVTLHNDSIGCADPKYIRVKGMRVDQIKDSYRSYVSYADTKDVIPPSVEIDSFKLDKQTLFLKLTVPDDLIKIEISVAGKILDSIYTGNFSTMNINLGSEVSNPADIKILAYDHLLNCSVMDLVITNSIPTKTFSKLVISPNPCVDYVNISCKQFITGTIHIRLQNLSGEMLDTYQKTFFGNQLNEQISLNGRASGIYFIRIWSNNFDKTFKVIKK
jgi:uncharacterized protein (DUF362 family)